MQGEIIKKGGLEVNQIAASNEDHFPKPALCFATTEIGLSRVL
jgi:hypothetical protein